MISACITCKKTFANMSGPWCETCEKEMNEWDDRLNPSKEEKPTTEKRKIDSGEKTQSSEKKSQLAAKPTMLRTQKDTEKLTERDITPIKNNETPNEPNGLEKIRSANLNTKELTIVKTQNDLEKSSTLPEVVETQPYEASTVNLKDLSQELSTSISLLNQSEKELFESMKGLRNSQPDTAVKLYDPQRVQTAVLCARQIADSMKTKLELMKFSKEISEI